MLAFMARNLLLVWLINALALLALPRHVSPGLPRALLASEET